MTDREEKLVELLKETGMLEIEDCLYIAEHLTANGVTVKEPQKPLTVEEVHAKQNEIMYLEYAQNKLEEFPVLLTFFGAFYAEFEKYGGEGADFLIDEYNYKWRSWAETPTEEERRAAEWEN